MMGKTLAKGLWALAALALAAAACLAAGLGAWQASAEEADGVEVSTAAHMQTYGDSDGDGGLAGLPGEDKRLEALAVSVEAPEGVDLGVSYSVYSEGHGWLEGADGVLAGTSGESLSISRVVVELTGGDAGGYAVWYRAWVDGYGWTGWACGGQECGTHSSGATVEAVEVVVLPAGESPSGDVTPRVVTTAATCGEAVVAVSAADDAQAEEGAEEEAVEEAAAESPSSSTGSSSAAESSASSESSASGEPSASSSDPTSSDDSTSSADYYEILVSEDYILKVSTSVTEHDVWMDYTLYESQLGYDCFCVGDDGLVYTHEFGEETTTTTTDFDGLCTTTYTTTTTKTCSRCGATVTTDVEYEYEYSHDWAELWRHVDMGYECYACGEYFHILDELEAHQQEVHGFKGISWNWCVWAIQYTTSSDLVFGEYEDEVSWVGYKCTVCGETDTWSFDDWVTVYYDEAI